MSSAVTRSHSLSSHQQRILRLVFKFRFVTIPLLQHYLHLKHQSTIRRSLQLLEQYGYLTSIYDSSYKIDRKPALYILSPKGLRFFKDEPTIEPAVLHAYYKNKYLSDAFKQHQLAVLEVCTALRKNSDNPPHVAIFTKAETTGVVDFPTPPPDLYIRSDTGAGEYFIELVHDQLPFLVRKRIAALIDHSEEEGWSTGQYPTLLFVCQSKQQQTRCLKEAQSLREGAGIPPDELPVAATTFDALLTAATPVDTWTVGESDPPIQLG